MEKDILENLFSTAEINRLIKKCEEDSDRIWIYRWKKGLNVYIYEKIIRIITPENKKYKFTLEEFKLLQAKSDH